MNTCANCGERPVHAKGYCDPCYKRLVWRPMGGPGVDRERAASRAYKDRNREAVRAQDREYKRRPENRGTCDSCGDPKGVGQANRGRLCAACVTARRDAKWLEIQRLWREGLKQPEITSALGITAGHLNVEKVRMRRSGWDLPYRYRVREDVRVAA